MKCPKHPNATFYTFPNGRHHYCRACHLEKNRRYEERHPEKTQRTMRAVNYKRRYGLTVVQYETYKWLQGNRCAMCRQKGKKLVVDHNHETELVRGLLCTPCNLFLGRYEKLNVLAQKYLGDR